MTVPTIFKAKCEKCGKVYKTTGELVGQTWGLDKLVVVKSTCPACKKELRLWLEKFGWIFKKYGVR